MKSFVQKTFVFLSIALVFVSVQAQQAWTPEMQVKTKAVARRKFSYSIFSCDLFLKDFLRIVTD